MNKKLKIRNVDLINSECSIIYYVANRLKDAGFGLKFNVLDVYLKESDIEFTSKIKVEILPNGDTIYEEIK